MFWRIAIGLAVIAGSSTAWADESETSDETEIVAQPDAVDNQEIGVVLGVAMGGSVSPGGLAVEGRYLYRMSDLDWLESSVHFSFGGGGAECFVDRQDDVICSHGLVDGFLGQANAGVRRYFAGQKEFRPFVRLGAGIGIVSFGDDDVFGVAIPFYAGAGIRAQVAPRVLVVVDATLRMGPAFLNRDLGVEPHFTGTVAAGVEFTLE